MSLGMGPDWDGNEWWGIEARNCARDYGYDEEPEELENECPECGNPCGEFCVPCSRAAADFEERAYGPRD